MNDNGPYKVELLSPAQTADFLSKRSEARRPSHLGVPLHPDHRKMVLASGFELKGSFELIARDAKTGAVDWQVEQPNLITDLGRQFFYDLGWTSIRIGFTPSTETPSVFRSSVGCDGSQTFVSVNLGSGTVTPSTYTKQWSTTFGTPGANRTLGTIFISYFSGTANDANLGMVYAHAYSLLTPPKTQTTTQTLEVIYKLSMNPIY